MPGKQTHKNKKKLETELKEEKNKRKEEEQKNKSLEERIKKLESEIDKKDEGAEVMEIKNTLQELASSIKTLKKSIESEEGNEKLISDAQKIILSITHDPKAAKQIGNVTGINISTLQKELERLMAGEATEIEILNTIDNAWGIAKGYFIGNATFDDLIKQLTSVNKDESPYSTDHR